MRKESKHEQKKCRTLYWEKAPRYQTHGVQHETKFNSKYFFQPKNGIDRLPYTSVYRLRINLYSIDCIWRKKNPLKANYNINIRQNGIRTAAILERGSERVWLNKLFMY